MTPADAATWLTLEVDVDEVGAARRRLIDQLESAGHDVVFVRDAGAVLSELLMNAMIHGVPDDDGHVHAGWRFDRDGSLELEVRDSGGYDVPTPRAAGDADGSGRGLTIVDGTCTSWDVDTTDGTVVRARLSPPPTRVRRLRPGSAGDS
ncbi:MAG: hypothetical protein CMH83_01710 [Nocardioides sp.]|nr:hypothetical protein [Nocardioides sp.]